MWKAVHNAFRCGAFWSHVTGMEHRSECSHCGVTESLDHILLSCRAVGQSQVWALTATAWRQKGLTWPSMSLATVLSAGCTTWKGDNGRRILNGASRLWRILVSESAFLIWRLRCERVIQHADTPSWTHATHKIRQLWLSTMNRRLHIDLLRCGNRLGRPSISRIRVLQTWHGVLEDERGLHPDGDWTRTNRVLVGISSSVFLDAG